MHWNRNGAEVWQRTLRVLSVFAALFVSPNWASAHFILQQPPAWMSQDSVGAPEKLGPCGDEGGGTPTGTVTAFQPGQTITITLQEVVFHPGHYRVALSVNSRSELPAEPLVTATASTPCGSVPVQSPAAFPVLADGVLDHSSPFTSPQSIQVTLPSDVTCTHCTLQIIEFMSDHPLNNPGGCFYHHCADISIQPASGTTGTGGSAAVSTSSGVGGALTGGANTASGGHPSIGGASSNSTERDAGAITNETNNVGSCSCAMPGSARNLGVLPLAFGVLVAGWRRPRGKGVTAKSSNWRRTNERATWRA